MDTYILILIISGLIVVLLSVVIFLLSNLDNKVSDYKEQLSVNTGEVQEMIGKLKEEQRQAYTDMMSELKGYTERVKTEENEDIDEELYELAKKEVIGAGKASTSYLQRKLSIGYSRASRLIDMLEENGIIGPAVGATPRTVISEEE